VQSGRGADGTLILSPIDGRRSGRGQEERRGRVTFATTDDAGNVVDDAKAQAVDREIARRRRHIAARLWIPPPRKDLAARAGRGPLASVPYRGGSDEIDLERTLDRLVENPRLDEERIVVRDRIAARRSVVLALDVSGSMSGERIRSATATIAALASELRRDEVGMIAFWSDAMVLADVGDELQPERLADQLQRIPALGLTNLAFPLELARRQLQRNHARDARVVLLSDCVHNAGPDPRPLAAALPRVDVLLDVSGEHDQELAQDIVTLGRGALKAIRGYRDVGPALTHLFAV